MYYYSFTIYLFFTLDLKQLCNKANTRYDTYVFAWTFDVILCLLYLNFREQIQNILSLVYC